MVKVTRQIFDLSDIQAVRLQCGYCQREAVQPLESTDVPLKCPFCNEEWEAFLPGDSRGANYHLIRYMKDLAGQKKPHMTVRFEIDAEETK